MKLLDYMNIMAIGCQNDALNDSDPNNDTEAGQYLAVLERAKHEILSQNFFKWNSVYIELTPDAEGNVIIPNRSGVINYRFDPNLNNSIVESEIGGPLWDRNANNKYSNNIIIQLSTDVNLELIPEKFAIWIAWRATELMSLKLNGIEGNMQFIRSEKIKARAIALNTEPGNIDNVSNWGAIARAYLSSNFVSRNIM